MYHKKIGTKMIAVWLSGQIPEYQTASQVKNPING